MSAKYLKLVFYQGSLILKTAVRGLELRELREVRSKPGSSQGNKALLNF